MDRWNGKIAVVTGAGTGIGAAIAIDLVKAGMITIGLGRRPERIENLKEKISATKKMNLHAFKCDVTSNDDIKTAFDWIVKKFGGVDVLVNNAGILINGSLLELSAAEVKSVVDTNINGLIGCTTEAFKSMNDRNVAGHIILICSTVGQNLGGVRFNMNLNVYSATKHAVKALTEIYRQEFMAKGTKIKISSVSPGWVETEIIPPEVVEQKKKEGISFLKSEDISEAVLYVLGTPAHVQVHELLIKPLGEPYL